MIRELIISSMALCVLASCASNELELPERAQQDAEATQLTIGWKDPIYSEDFGLEPNPNVDGKSLADIVMSVDFGREDGQLCSACHNNTYALGDYGVDAEINAASPEMEPTDPVSGRTWIEEGGWSDRFIDNPTKPANIKGVIDAWRRGGYRD